MAGPTKANSNLFRASQATMTVSVAVFLYEGFAYNFTFLGRILPAIGKQYLVVPFAIVFNLFWGLAMWSYVKAHRADPGRVPERWRDFVYRLGDMLPIAPARAEWQPGKATYCKKCDLPRPERAHHCLLCEVCVMRMDHHCPWINNCVGFHNHKYFLLLGVYACVASYLALVTAAPELMHAAGALTRIQDGYVLEPGSGPVFEEKSGFISSGENILEESMTVEEAKAKCAMMPTCRGFTFEGSPQGNEVVHVYFKDKWDLWGTGWTSFKRSAPEAGARLEVTDILIFIIFGILATFVAVLLTPMLATHVPLALQNVTTIEDNYENMPNPYDQGSALANLAQVMGVPGPDWFIPVEPWRPLTDGVSFARADERSGFDDRYETAIKGEPEVIWTRRYHVRNHVPQMREEMPDTSVFGTLGKWWNGP